MMRELFIAALDEALSLADAQMPQPLNVFGGVVAVTVLLPTGQRQRPQAFAETELRGCHAQLVGRLPDGLWFVEHGLMVRLNL
jgi:hypothetical protein